MKQRCWGVGLRGDGDPWGPKSWEKGFLVLVGETKVRVNPFFFLTVTGHGEGLGKQQSLAGISAPGAGRAHLRTWRSPWCLAVSDVVLHHRRGETVSTGSWKGRQELPTLRCRHPPAQARQAPREPRTTSVASRRPTQLN